MRKTLLIGILFLITSSAFAQKKTTTSATISFDATTSKDGLPKAENKAVIGSINTQTGAVAFEAAVKNFSFTNPKMQQHFNDESWLKSDTYPVITFNGKLEKMKTVNFGKDGLYKVTVIGDLKIKDVVKQQKINGTITILDGKINVAAEFKVKLSDYNISGQPVDAGKVSKEPKILVSASF